MQEAGEEPRIDATKDKQDIRPPFQDLTIL